MPSNAVATPRQPRRTNILAHYNYWTSIPLIGHYIFSLLLAFSSPYTGSIPLRITHLATDGASGRMKMRRSILNPFGSIHAAALINFGEAIGGVAVVSAVEAHNANLASSSSSPSQQPLRAIVTSLRATYHKKSRGIITGQVRLDGRLDVGTRIVECVVTDESEDVVCRVFAEWVFGVYGGEVAKDK